MRPMKLYSPRMDLFTISFDGDEIHCRMEPWEEITKSMALPNPNLKWVKTNLHAKALSSKRNVKILYFFYIMYLLHPMRHYYYYYYLFYQSQRLSYMQWEACSNWLCCNQANSYRAIGRFVQYFSHNASWLQSFQDIQGTKLHILAQINWISWTRCGAQHQTSMVV